MQSKHRTWTQIALYSVLSLSLTFYGCKDDDPEPIVITASDLEVTIKELPTTGTILGTIEASINKGEISFEIKSQSAAGAIVMDAATGVVSVADASKFDFDANQTLTAIVTIISGNLTRDINVTVHLVDVVIISTAFEITIDENPAVDFALGTIQASSEDGPLSFQIKSQSATEAFAVDASTGKLTVADASKFDYEAQHSLTGIVTARIGNVTKDINVTINLQKIIWTGANVTFTKASGAAWTLAANQDKITDKAIITRQSKGPIYNIQWWMNKFQADATYDDLNDDFWNSNGSDREFKRSGGTGEIRWAILDDTGMSGDLWDNFQLYGKLGDPTHFYSFHNIASIIYDVENDKQVVSVVNDFDLEYENSIGQNTGTNMPMLVGKKLGMWIVEEDIYLTISFTNWGQGGANSVSYTRSSKD